MGSGVGTHITQSCNLSFRPQSYLKVSGKLYTPDVTKTRNGEWGMGNGEWGMGNGKWEMGMGNGERGIGSGEWKIENGKWVIGNWKYSH